MFIYRPSGSHCLIWGFRFRGLVTRQEKGYDAVRWGLGVGYIRCGLRGTRDGKRVGVGVVG